MSRLSIRNASQLQSSTRQALTQVQSGGKLPDGYNFTHHIDDKQSSLPPVPSIN